MAVGSSFKALRKNSDVRDLQQKIENEQKKRGVKTWENDKPETYYPQRDKNGNGFAILRFLPACEGEDLPFVQLYSHSYHDPITGKWYIENSRSTLGEIDPMGKLNSYLWNTVGENIVPSLNKSGKQIVRELTKRKSNYYSNVYIIKDVATPENEGKVMLYSYPNVIYGKITDKISPEMEGIDPQNIFDFWKGNNFELRIKRVGQWPNYTDSQFQSSSALLNGDEAKLEEVWKSQQKLSAIVDPSKFKTYAELEARLISVLCPELKQMYLQNIATESVADISNIRIKQAITATKENSVVEEPPFDVDSDTDDSLSEFQKLVDES